MTLLTVAAIVQNAAHSFYAFKRGSTVFELVQESTRRDLLVQAWKLSIHWLNGENNTEFYPEILMGQENLNNC